MTGERAEEVALMALGWLAAEDELLPVFLGTTGADLTALRAQAHTPALQGSVLDFILMDAAWVLAAAGALGLQPEEFFQARQMLPGGATVHWT